MHPQNQWLDNEMQSIAEERKKVKIGSKCSHRTTIFLFFSTIFFCSYDLEASQKSKINVDNGVWWICPTCRTAQWQDNKNANWRGEFFCNKCGQKK